MIMQTVFLLQHAHRTDDDEEDIKIIGIYDCRQSAEHAIDRMRSRPGFLDHPDGFHIDEYRINQDHWSEGFVSWSDALSTPHPS